MVASALSMELAAVAMFGGATRAAAGFAGTAVALVVWRRCQIAGGRNGGMIRSLVRLCCATILVAASFTPYLVVERDSSHPDESPEAERAAGSSASIAGGARRTSLLWRVFSMFSKPGAGSFVREEKEHARGGEPPRISHPYPALAALFGDTPVTRPNTKRRPGTAVMPGESYPGLILRPEFAELVMLVPPPQKHRLAGEGAAASRAKPLSIPFYGVYWYFRSREGTLPADAVESRGDAADRVFRTTDLSPISMEARQNFGKAIPLSCCKLIEILIANGDQRPNKVSIELVLRNSRLPEKPAQSLGLQPVTSTQRRRRGEHRPPEPEVLAFRIPSSPSIQEFDEVLIRFHLGFRRVYSPRIGIREFRLVPPAT